LGLFALVVSTLAFSLGQNTLTLFIGRLAQGGSSAIVHTVGMAILADTVGQAGVGPAMGFATMSIALGVVLGPMLGGILYHQFGYLAVFVSAYALVALDFVLRILMVMPEDGAGEKPLTTDGTKSYGTFANDDGEHHNTSAGGFLEHGQRKSSSSSSTSVSTESSLLPESYPLSKELPSNLRSPLIILLSSPRMLAAILGDFMQSTILTGLESILPLRIKTLFSYNSIQVALVFMTLSLPCFAGPAIGHLSDRIGAKIMVCLGFLSTAPLLMLLRLVDHDGEETVALLCVLLLLTGVALNMILTPVFSEAMYVVDEKTANDPGIFGAKGAYAQAFGLMNVAYAAGSLVGPLMGGLLVESVGWNDLTLGTGIVCALCVLPCLYATGGRQVREAPSAMENDEHPVVPA